MQEQIIQHLKAQNKEAIELLYDHYAGALYGIVLRIVRSRELAEQVMQDTFVKAWRNGANYDASKGRLFTWLLNIARNTAIDATRTSHFRHRKVTDGMDVLQRAANQDSINFDTLGLQEAVDKMDARYSLLIDLVYFQQYTQKEAAEVTGVPLGTVKTRMRLAISLLRKSFN